MIYHPASHAEDAGPIYFSNRLRIADVCPSIHFIADDFLRFALKPACALLPLPARVFGVQQHERNRLSALVQWWTFGSSCNFVD